MSEPVKLILYQGNVFRIFSTAHPSQELLDDLLDESQEYDLLKPLFYTEKEPASMDRLERILQRSANEIIQAEISEKFCPQNWFASRFSDGTWGVLYSAESSQTAQAESLYHRRKFYQEELEQGPVSIDLCQAQLEISSNKAVDLTKNPKIDRSKLTSKNEDGYPYCQKIAEQCIKLKAQLIRTLSARDQQGICIPIFDRSVIKRDSGPLNYIKAVLYKDRTELFISKEN